MRFRRCIVASILSACVCFAHADSIAVQSKQHVVTIENMQFAPQKLTVRRGDRIVWMNKDLFPHTVTAVSKAFDSGAIQAQARWAYVANTPGEYAYVCTYHPTMQAVLIVD